MLRFRHAEAKPLAERRVGQTFPEIVLLNSHDGTNAYRVMSGVFRLVCVNGMIVADRQGAKVCVPLAWLALGRRLRRGLVTEKIP